MTTLAFLGTGTMGLPMARNLARAGFEIRAWNRTPERARPLEEDGATVAAEPRDAAANSELLVTMLSDTVEVLDSARAALSALAPGATRTVGCAGTPSATVAAELPWLATWISTPTPDGIDTTDGETSPDAATVTSVSTCAP